MVSPLHISGGHVFNGIGATGARPGFCGLMVDMDFCIEIYLRILRQYVCQRSALVNSEHIAAVIQHFRCDAPDVRKAVHFLPYRHWSAREAGDAHLVDQCLADSNPCGVGI